DRDQEFAVLQNGATGGDAEILDRDLASPTRPGNHTDGRMGDARRNRGRGGRGVAEVAADAGAALDLHAADQPHSVHQPGEGSGNSLVVIEPVAGYRRAEL